MFLSMTTACMSFYSYVRISMNDAFRGIKLFVHFLLLLVQYQSYLAF